MANIFPGSVILKNNPVTRWEKYSRTWSESQDILALSAKDSADGGPESMSMTIRGSLSELRELLTNGLGRHIDMTTPYGQVFWDGQVMKVSLKAGPLEFVRDLGDSWNRMWLRYRTIGGATTLRSTTLNDLTPQIKWGIREYVGNIAEVASLAVADQLANRYVDYYSIPRIKMFISPGEKLSDKNISLTLTGKGYGDTLDWRRYNQTATPGVQSASLEVADVVTATGQFIASSSIATNTTQVARVYDIDRKAASILSGISGLGDSSYNRWLWYVGIGRKFCYEQAASPVIAATAVKYRLNAFDEPMQIRNHIGRPMRGYEVVPNTWIRARGILLESGVPASLLEDAEAAYVETVDRELVKDELSILTSRTQRGDILLQRAAGGTGA